MNEYEARLNVQQARREVYGNELHIKKVDSNLFWAAVLTTLLYFLFAFSLYVGDFYNIKSLLTDLLSGSVGLVIYCAVAGLLAFVLAGTKHAAFNHFAKFKPVGVVIVLMALFGIMAESFTSSAVQDVKARATTSQNAEYQQLTTTSDSANVTADPALTANIARATQVLERCKTNLAAGKEKHCNGDQGKLDSLLATQQALFDAKIQASNANFGLKNERIDQLKDESYNPWIRSIADSFNLKMSQGIALLMISFAFMLEAMHYYNSIMKRQAVAARDQLQAALNQALVIYYNAAGKEYTDNAASEAAKENTSPSPAPAQTTQPAGDTLSDNPDENRKRWGLTPAVGVGVGIGSDGLSAGAGAGVMASPKAQMFQPAFPKSQSTVGSTFAEPFRLAETSYSRITAQQPKSNYKTANVGFMGDLGTAKASVNDAADSDKPVTVTKRDQHQSTNHQPSNDSRPPATEGQPLSSEADTAKTPSETTPTEGINNPSTRATVGDKSIDTNKLYHNWVSDLESGSVRPSVSASWKWLQQRVSKSQSIKKAPTPQHMTEIVQLFIRRAIHDEVLINNPKYKNGLPKYLLKEK